jgi:hypothetical protein
MLRTATLTSVALAFIAPALAGRGVDLHARSPVFALAPSLSVDECIEVEPGDTFTVSVLVAGVTDLLAWDIYYAYNLDVVEVIGKDVREFLDEEPNSNVFDFSDPVPNSTGLYHVGAADIGGGDAAEDGGGVLAVLTLHARARGLSWSSLYRADTNRDGVMDYGPTLTQVGGTHVADTNGDGVFDGALSGGQIAVGRACREPAPTPYVDLKVTPKPTGTPHTAGTATPTLRPNGSTAEPGPGSTDAGQGSSGSQPGSEGTATRTPRPTARGGSEQPGGGSSGGGVSALVATLIGAGGGAGIIAAYIIVRAARRPA